MKYPIVASGARRLIAAAFAVVSVPWLEPAVAAPCPPGQDFVRPYTKADGTPVHATCVPSKKPVLKPSPAPTPKPTSTP